MPDLTDWHDGYHDGRMDAESESERLRARVESLEADRARLIEALEFYAKLEGNGQNFRVVEPSKDGSFVSMGSRARAELGAMKGDGDD